MAILKILLLIGAVFVMEKVFEKFRDRDKLVLELESLNTNFSNYKDSMDKIIKEYKSAYSELATDYRTFQSKSEKLMDESNQMISEILHYADTMIKDNKRLYARLNLVDKYLSTDDPSQEEKALLQKAIAEDIQLKDEYEKGLEELTHKRPSEHRQYHGPELGDDYE